MSAYLLLMAHVPYLTNAVYAIGLLSRRLTAVVAVHVVATKATVGKNVSALVADVNDGAAGRGDGAPAARGRSIGKSDGAKVGKGNLAAARLKVLDDPFGIGLAEGGGGAAELVLDLLAGAQVL